MASVMSESPFGSMSLSRHVSGSTSSRQSPMNRRKSMSRAISNVQAKVSFRRKSVAPGALLRRQSSIKDSEGSRRVSDIDGTKPKRSQHKKNLSAEDKLEVVASFYRSGGMDSGDRIAEELKRSHNYDILPQEVRALMKTFNMKPGGYDPVEDQGWVRMSQWYEITGYIKRLVTRSTEEDELANAFELIGNVTTCDAAVDSYASFNTASDDITLAKVNGYIADFGLSPTMDIKPSSEQNRTHTPRHRVIELDDFKRHFADDQEKQRKQRGLSPKPEAGQFGQEKRTSASGADMLPTLSPTMLGEIGEDFDGSNAGSQVRRRHSLKSTVRAVAMLGTATKDDRLKRVDSMHSHLSRHHSELSESHSRPMSRASLPLDVTFDDSATGGDKPGAGAGQRQSRTSVAASVFDREAAARLVSEQLMQRQGGKHRRNCRTVAIQTDEPSFLQLTMPRAKDACVGTTDRGASVRVVDVVKLLKAKRRERERQKRDSKQSERTNSLAETADELE